MNDDDLTELEELLSDRWNRLTSGKLYKIKTADGRGVIPFHPRDEQKELLRKLCDSLDRVRAHAKHIKDNNLDPAEVVPIEPPQEVEIKSRRLGYSTTIGVFVADCLAFCKDFTAQLIDQTADDASKKMNGIVKVAVDALIEAGWPLKKIKDNDGELTVDAVLDGLAQKSPSTFFAGTKGRGGSVDFGWYSELGVIQFEDEPRAEEIVTGAFAAARHGIKFVETTWKGGKGGKLWDLIEPTLNGIADDWKVHFTPWFVDPRNRSTTAVIDDKTRKYFADNAARFMAQGVTITEDQMRWYSAEWRTQGIFMKRENPSFLDECWTAPIEGSVYAAAIEQARTEGRVAMFPIDGTGFVNTSWDLGAPKNTVVWYWQAIGREIRIVDVDQSFDGTLVERAAMMKAKGYAFGSHYVPHDAMQTTRSGSTFLTELSPLLPNVVTVPKCHTEWIGINHLLQMFPTLAFRSSPEVLAGLETLACYHTRKSGPQAGELVHDWSSHTADALRTMAEAHRADLFKFKHSAAEPRPDWYDLYGRKKKGLKARMVSGLRV